MTVLGSTAKPGYSFVAYDGTSNPNQMVELLTAPQRIKLVTLGGWIGGWNTTAHCRLAVFDGSTKALLGYTAEFIVANEGAPGTGNVAKYEHDLTTPIDVADGDTFYVGTIRNRDDAVQWSIGTAVNAHYEGRGGYPDANLGAVSGPTSVARRIGMYVADYQPVSAAWVYRSGVWVQADSVQTYDGATASWVDVAGVQAYRTGAWVDVN